MTLISLNDFFFKYFFIEILKVARPGACRRIQIFGAKRFQVACYTVSHCCIKSSLWAGKKNDARIWRRFKNVRQPKNSTCLHELLFDIRRLSPGQKERADCSSTGHYRLRRSNRDTFKCGGSAGLSVSALAPLAPRRKLSRTGSWLRAIGMPLESVALVILFNFNQLQLSLI